MRSPASMSRCCPVLALRESDVHARTSPRLLPLLASLPLSTSSMGDMRDDDDDDASLLSRRPCVKGLRPPPFPSSVHVSAAPVLLDAQLLLPPTPPPPLPGSEM